jgi:hypothetical protein
MMRTHLIRLAALAGGIAVVASCDTRLPTSASPLGGGSSSNNTNVKGPTISIDTPVVGSLANIGDSILVVMHLHDDKALRSVVVQGLKETGSVDLGTFSQTVRFTPVTAPVSGSFRAGLRDTVIRRFIRPAAPLDSTLDSLIIQAVVTDSANVADTVTRRVDLVSGPQVSILAPANGDSTPAGIGLSATARAQHPDGIGRITIRFQGEASWPTKFDTSITQNITGAPRDISVSAIARVPADAPLRGRITVTASAVSVTGRPGNTPSVVVFARSGSNAQPLVTQTVAARLEIADSVTVSARGDGIRSIGYVARDSVGNVVARDSVVLAPPFAGNMSATISLNKLAVTLRGKKVAITGFAVDQAGRTGFAARAGQLTPNSTLNGAFVDSALIVFGQTFPLPQARNTGLVGDLVWDAPRGNVILSNQVFNRLEIFHTATNTYDPNGVAVGSFPWGLFISNDPDVLWVANSGGTNITRVDLVGQQELAAQRIRTRITPLYTLTEDASQVDSTKPPTFTDGLSDPVLFSDRPQYIGQLSDGTVYYSTRPTPDAPKGTIRFLDPTQPFPDSRAIIIFKKGSGTNKTHVIVNADSAAVFSGAPSSDLVRICDHAPGTNQIGACAITNKGYQATFDALKKLVPTTDVVIIDGVDITDAGLTDTTYVSVSGDRGWVAFGSGNTAGSGNIFMASVGGFNSPPISQIDLTNNASEHINGIALDSTGLTVGAHGIQSFFASVDVPFHLRLQGKYQNAAAGAGIAMHPRAKASFGSTERTAYVASGNASVEIIDIFHYLNRGTLPIKVNLYGPLRAALPGPTDLANGVVLKLFGVSANGLVVIDLRATDILPSP